VTKCPPLGPFLLLLAGACSATAGPGGAGASAPNGVSGRVIDADGEPAAGVHLQLGTSLDGAVLTTTDADGRFTLADAPSTYDLSAVAREVYVFEGLTTRSPTLALFGVHLSPRWHSAIIHADVGTGPTILLAEPSDDSTTHVSLDKVAGTDDEELSWVGDGPAHVNFFALVLAPEPGAGYAGIASLPGARVADGSRFAMRGSLRPVEEASVTATVSADGDTSVDGISAALRVGSRGAPAWLPDGAAPPSSRFEIKVPQIAGATVDLFAVGSSAAGTVSTKRGGVGANGDVRLELPASPSLDAPADGARDMTVGSELRWRSAAATVHWVRIHPLDRDAPAYWIATTSGSVRIPDVEALGAALVPGETYGWYVVDAVGATNVDDAAVVGAMGSVDGPAGNTRERTFEARR
jgi:Carboxypeptidase regulatory-like domain